MKNKFLAVALASFAFSPASRAASFFFSFDTMQNGTSAGTLGLTSSTFPGTPSFARTGANFQSDLGGGEASFTDFEGKTWLGSGNSSTPGHSSVWNSGTGNSFSTTFSTVGLTDVTLRMAVRSAGGGPPTSFSSFTYDIGGGEVATGGPTGSFTNSFTEYAANLSGISAINGKSSVTLKWTFADLPSNTSFRVDNLQVNAVPEPSALLLSLGGLAAALLVRRR